MRGRTGVPRGYALETVHEVLESGVQAVDAVDGVHGRVPAFQRRAEAFEDGGVGPGLGGDDKDALADTLGYHEEGCARFVDAGGDAYLLLDQAAFRGLLAALAGRAGVWCLCGSLCSCGGSTSRQSLRGRRQPR